MKNLERSETLEAFTEIYKKVDGDFEKFKKEVENSNNPLFSDWLNVGLNVPFIIVQDLEHFENDFD